MTIDASTSTDGARRHVADAARAAHSADAARPTSLNAWLLATRPATLFACLSPIVASAGIAAADGNFDVRVCAIALVASGFIQIGTNLYNDYADHEKGADNEDRVGPKRATQQGWLTPQQVKGAAYVAFGMALASGAALVAKGGLPILATGVTSVVAGLAYTGGPYPLAYTGLGDLFVMLFFGFVAVGGMEYLQSGRMTDKSLFAGGAVGALNTAILVVNNLRDRHTDKVADKRTLAVRFGETFARTEYIALLGLAYALPAAGVASGRLGIGWLTPLATLPMAAKQLRAVLSKDGAALNPHLGGTSKLGLAYAAATALGASRR